MTVNRFEPPRAEVADVTPGSSPLLWNPVAAALWSLLFTPAFGALLHMKNWRALGQSSLAASSRNWAIGIFIVEAGASVVSSVRPFSAGLERLFLLGSLVLLLCWYLVIGGQQVARVRAEFAGSYRRKGWLLPLALATLATLGVAGVGATLEPVVKATRWTASNPSIEPTPFGRLRLQWGTAQFNVICWGVYFSYQ